MNNIYICIDLKSFYASVECVERKLNPMTTNLVVADKTRTDKTICLAVTPALKTYGISGRARLFEVIQKVKEINNQRKNKIANGKFKGTSYDSLKLEQNKYLKLNYIVAPPRMSLYIKYSTIIYSIYLKYFSKEDIFVYSIDEVFCDITNYLKYYKMTPQQLVTKVLQDVYLNTGITATCGIGTNMFLAKVAMDILAKHSKPDQNGVRIATLDEIQYRKKLWCHEPLTDFWRIGVGYNKKLLKYGMKTMGDICRCSINNIDLLYKLFGVNAEILIDHAWGYESCSIRDIKKYKPISNSISSGQILSTPYNFIQTRLIIREMTDLLVLELVRKQLITDTIVLTIEYNIKNLNNNQDKNKSNYYEKILPKRAHGSKKLSFKTFSNKIIMKNTLELYDEVINKNLLVRKLNLSFNNLTTKSNNQIRQSKQFNLFTNDDELNKQNIDIKKEEQIQNTILKIKDKFGKNAILKAMNLEQGATTIIRNKQIGGHRAS